MHDVTFSLVRRSQPPDRASPSGGLGNETALSLWACPVASFPGLQSQLTLAVIEGLGTRLRVRGGIVHVLVQRSKGDS